MQCNARLGGAEQPRPLPRPRAGEHVADRDDEGETYSQIDIMRRTPGLVFTVHLTVDNGVFAELNADNWSTLSIIAHGRIL